MNNPAARALAIEKKSNKLPTWISKLINDVKHKRDSVTCTTRNHQRNELMVTANPIYDNDGRKITMLVYNIRDITELTALKNELKNSKELSQRYREELNRLKNKYEKDVNIIFRSKKMDHIIDLCLRVAEVDSTVLILGETGVGKQLIAEMIHKKSHRKRGPFIEVNCGAIPENLLESELFGYEPGTFTGGLKSGKIGIFEQANKGTIFLDEIGDLPYALQVKLLKVLQNSEVVRLGSAKPRKVDVRVISATNKDIKEMVNKGQFREDLYYRLNIVPIIIPPLRERKEDIIPIIYHYKLLLESKYNRKIDFHPEVLELFLKHDWPGNVRELQNVVERIFVTAKKSVIEPEQVIPLFANSHKSESIIKNIITESDSIIPLKEAKELLETKLIKMALKKYGSTYRAAKVLGVNQSTIARKAKKLLKDYNLRL